MEEELGNSHTPGYRTKVVVSRHSQSLDEFLAWEILDERAELVAICWSEVEYVGVKIEPCGVEGSCALEGKRVMLQTLCTCLPASTKNCWVIGDKFVGRSLASWSKSYLNKSLLLATELPNRKAELDC